jgi:hypothetical protein
VPPGGRFGSPGTIILDGGERIDYGTFNGVMATTGVWLNDHVGIESSGFVTEHRSDTFGVSDFGATGPLSIVRPIALPSGGAFAPGVVGVPVAVPGALAGGVLRSASARLWGADGDLVFNLRSSCQSRLDLLAGFAYYDLRETLATNQSTVNVGPGPAPGTGVNTADLFDTRNQFYGGQLGTRWTATRGRLSLSWVSKIAVGDSHESVDRQGTTVAVTPTGTFGIPGGLLVGPTAAGRDTRDQFAVVLPSTFQLGYQVTDHLNAFVGYTYVYWSSVARPGDQITSASATGGPAVGVNPTDFTASGFTFGMGYKW